MQIFQFCLRMKRYVFITVKGFYQSLNEISFNVNIRLFSNQNIIFSESLSVKENIASFT